MPNNYCTVPQVWQALPDANPGSSGAYDTLIESLIGRACRMFDRQTHREPGAYARSSTDTETRYFDGSGGAYQWVDEICAAPTSVSVSQTGSLADSDYTAYSSTDYVLWPYNAAAKGEPYTRLDLDTINGSQSAFYRFPKSVKIVAPFGYCDTSDTPPEIVEAMIIQVARWFGRGRQGYQDTGAIVELGQLTYTQRFDPDVAEVVDQFKRVAI